MENRKFGAIYSPTDVRDYRIACTSKATFPTEFELDMPEVKDQGNVSSCVAHALSTVIEYFSRAQEDNYSPMSVGYIYGNRGHMFHKGEGMVTRSAIRVACEYGDIPEVLFPYNEEVPTIIDKFEEVKDEFYKRGATNRLSTYFQCFTEAEVKTALMKKAPIVIAMDWYSDMEVIDGVMHTEENEQDIVGGHCMVLYGWNEIGWKIQNSWGAEWGDEGRFILPYHVTIREFWGVTDEYTQRIKIEELENSNSELNSQIAELNSEIKAMKSEQLSKTTELLNVWNQNTVLSLKISNYEAAVDDLEIENANLEEVNASLKEANDELIRKLEELNVRIKSQLDIENEIRKNLAELEATLTNVSKQLVEAEALVEKQKAEIERLNNEIIEIKKPYDSNIGRFFAKILNFFSNISNKNK